MFEAPRLAVIITLALMTVGAVWACVQGGPLRAAATGTRAQEASVQDALRAVLREAAVSAAEDTETQSIVPAATLCAHAGDAIIHFVAMPVQALGALRRAAMKVPAAAPRGPPAAV